jgi:hypothetical protein
VTTAGGSTLSARSDQLVVSTGIADQDSFSLSMEQHNIEAWNYDGKTTSVTVHAADRFNNPVPDGTAVYFTTEAGSVGGSCTTQDGKCSVTWTSQDPRPADGRGTILATAIGEESFVDEDGNGRFGDGDSFTDLPEAFLDKDEDGVRDAGERPADFNDNGTYDPADGKFNGLLCQHSTDCSKQETLNVRDSEIVVMSSTAADIDISPSPISAPATVTVSVQDVNGTHMAAGTTISATSDNGETSGKMSYTLADRTDRGPFRFSFSIAPDDESDSGLLTVTVTPPSGTVTTRQVTVTD